MGTQFLPNLNFHNIFKSGKSYFLENPAAAGSGQSGPGSGQIVLVANRFRPKSPIRSHTGGSRSIRINEHVVTLRQMCNYGN